MRSHSSFPNSHGILAVWGIISDSLFCILYNNLILPWVGFEPLTSTVGGCEILRQLVTIGNYVILSG